MELALKLRFHDTTQSTSTTGEDKSQREEGKGEKEKRKGKKSFNMAEERQPPNVVEGATTGDIDDEIQPTAKSAEDRKAAAALSKLDAREDETASRGVDQEAVSRAMNTLGGDKKAAEKAEVKKVKVDAADVALLVRHPYLPIPASSCLPPSNPMLYPLSYQRIKRVPEP